jgi:protein disulfide-isomerase-like protein
MYCRSLVLAAIALVFINGEEEKISRKASDVIVLTSKTFELETQAATGHTTGDWLVEFYAPWCGHCKHLQPVWEELATELKGVANVAKVDVTGNRDIGNRFDIKGFPTIKFFHHGNVYDYKGRRTKEAFVEFVKGGYESAQNSPVPGEMSWLESTKKAVTGPFLAAYKDINNGNYMTANVFVVSMPVLVLVVITFTMIVLPEPVVEPRAYNKGNKEPAKKD